MQGRPQAWLRSLPMGETAGWNLQVSQSHQDQTRDPTGGQLELQPRGPWDSAVPRNLRRPSPSEESGSQGLQWPLREGILCTS